MTKLTHLVRPRQSQSFEIHLVSPKHPPALFELYQCWEDDQTCHVITVPMQNRIQELQQTLENLREDLSPPASAGSSAISSVPKREGRSQLHLHLEAGSALETMEDMIMILRADLIELGKTAYSDIITDKINELREILAELKDK